MVVWGYPSISFSLSLLAAPVHLNTKSQANKTQNGQQQQKARSGERKRRRSWEEKGRLGEEGGGGGGRGEGGRRGGTAKLWNDYTVRRGAVDIHPIGLCWSRDRGEICITHGEILCQGSDARNLDEENSLRWYLLDGHVSKETYFVRSKTFHYCCAIVGRVTRVYIVGVHET